MQSTRLQCAKPEGSVECPWRAFALAFDGDVTIQRKSQKVPPRSYIRVSCGIAHFRGLILGTRDNGNNLP